MNKKLHLEEQLNERGLNLRLLSRKSGVAYATVYNLFTGQKDVATARVDSLKKLADALDMSMDELYDELSGKEKIPIKDFKVMWEDEIVADVEIQGNEASIKRYSTNVAKQIFYADKMHIFELGEIIKTRCWEKNRADCEQLLSLIQLDEYNPYEIVKKTHGLMVQDPIWFCFEGEKLTYKEVKRLRYDTGNYY